MLMTLLEKFSEILSENLSCFYYDFGREMWEFTKLLAPLIDSRCDA